MRDGVRALATSGMGSLPSHFADVVRRVADLSSPPLRLPVGPLALAMLDPHAAPCAGRIPGAAPCAPRAQHPARSIPRAASRAQHPARRTPRAAPRAACLRSALSQLPWRGVGT
ncbi:hypothetical protein Acsp02_00300 [Actinoplanes sp. NBRC 103695]|nr:hypothetical protein Acsp02_00300 [Actinoplanes sp. NBRC 103695]